MAKGSEVLFCYVNQQESFNNLDKKDNTLYFVKETKSLYKGSEKFTNTISLITNTELNNLAGDYDPSIIYVIVNNSTDNIPTGKIVKSSNGIDLQIICNAFNTNITLSRNENDIINIISNEDYVVPTTKAVHDFVRQVDEYLQGKINNLPNTLCISAGKYDSTIECLIFTIREDKTYPTIDPEPDTKDETNNYGYVSGEVIVVPVKDEIEEYLFQKDSTTNNKNISVVTERTVNGKSTITIDFNITGNEDDLVVIDEDGKSIKSSGYQFNKEETSFNDSPSATLIPNEKAIVETIKEIVEESSTSNTIYWDIL